MIRRAGPGRGACAAGPSARSGAVSVGPMSSRIYPRHRAVGMAFVVVLATAAITGCGGAAPIAAGSGPPSAVPSGQAAGQHPSGGPPSSQPPSSQHPSGGPPAGTAAVRHAFPAVGRASYARTHHDYPASDIIAGCGAAALSPVDGEVLEVNRVDTFDRRVNAGATRGGLYVSIRGDDGVRYYGSHYRSIDATIQPGTRVRAGQRIAEIGRTGDAGACHIHFGISPLCTGGGDWWIRRGVIFPWPYLDSWRAGGNRSPVDEIAGWKAAHGCPTQPRTP
jgi:peptidoglycan LD-endopeptidase LytH